MRIEKFSHVENGKIVYAVIGENNPEIAMEEVYKYKKTNRKDFYELKKSCFVEGENIIYTGLIKGNKLYRINIRIDDTFDKGITPCYIIARDTIDIDKYIQVAS